jgi:hypothetical protein
LAALLAFMETVSQEGPEKNWQELKTTLGYNHICDEWDPSDLPSFSLGT